jgi:hypothetical protein
LLQKKKKEEKQTPERHASNEIKFRKPPAACSFGWWLMAGADLL